MGDEALNQKDTLTEAVIGAAIEIHKSLGPGLLESAYEECLAYELRQRGIHVVTQIPVALKYKEIVLEQGYVLDLVVEHQLVIELKAVEKVLAVHEAQLLTYLKLSGIGKGLLINFNVPLLKDGIKRMVI